METATDCPGDRTPDFPQSGDSLGEPPEDFMTLLRAASLPLALLFAAAGMDYLTHTLFGQWLGEASYGDFGVAFSLALLLAYFAGLGSEESTPRFLPQYIAEGRFGHVLGFLYAHMMTILLVSGLIAIAGTVVFHLVRHESFRHPIAVIWWLLPLLALAEFLFTALNSLGRTRLAMAAHMVLWPLLVLGAGFFFWTYHHGRITSEHTIAANGIAVAAVLPIYFLLLRRSLPLSAWHTGRTYDYRLWFRTALPLVFATLVYYGLDQLDIYVMEHVGDEKEVGRLLACIKTTDFIYLAYSAAYLIVAPRISPLAESRRIRELEKFARVVTWWVLGVAGGVALVIIVLGKQMLGWFGHQFPSAYPVLVFLAITNVAVAAMSLSWPLLSLTGQERAPLPALAVATLVMAVAAEMAVPRFGMMGAAACKASVMIGLFGWFTWLVRQRLNIRLWGPLPRDGS